MAGSSDANSVNFWHWISLLEVFGLLGHNGAGKTQLGHIRVEWTRMREKEREREPRCFSRVSKNSMKSCEGDDTGKQI